MTLFAVQKEVPITVFVEAENEDAAKELADFTSVWEKLYGKKTPAVDAALAGLAIVGFPFDDTSVEERELTDIPWGVQIQRGVL